MTSNSVYLAKSRASNSSLIMNDLCRQLLRDMLLVHPHYAHFMTVATLGPAPRPAGGAYKICTYSIYSETRQIYMILPTTWSDSNTTPK